jgi:hypothetical protein
MAFEPGGVWGTPAETRAKDKDTFKNALPYNCAKVLKYGKWTLRKGS